MRTSLLPLCLALLACPAWADDAPPVPPDPAQDEAVDRATAIARFQEFIGANPERPEVAAARFRLASLLMEEVEGHPTLADRAAAAAQLEQALADQTVGGTEGFEHAAEAWYLLGFCRQEGDPAGAAQAWEQVLAVAPGTPLAASASLGLGQMALDAEDWEAAATRFEAARGPDRAAPSWAQATYLCAWSRYRAQDYAPAQTLLAELLGREEPAAVALQADALATLAFAVVDGSQEGGAVADVVTALLPSLPEPRRAELTAKVTELLEKLGRFDEAGDVRRIERRKGRRRR